jgi:hypothetical protein
VISAALDAEAGIALTATGTIYPMATLGGAYNFNKPQSVIVWNAATAMRRSAPDFPVPDEAVTARFTRNGSLA